MDVEKNREKLSIIKILAGFWYSVFPNGKKPEGVVVLMC